MADVSRRAALRMFAACSAFGMSPAVAKEIDRAYVWSAGAAPDATRKALQQSPVGLDRIWVRRDRGEEIISQYLVAGVYAPEQVRLLSFFWRDVKDNNAVLPIHPGLFGLMSALQTNISTLSGRPTPLNLTSGYRTPERNARIEGAARNSLHVVGYAADVTFAGFDPDVVAACAARCGAGGVGVYTSKHRFTHVDIGRIRSWRG